MVGQEGILLDSGTNEVEILELVVNGLSFGINVLKIQQILTYQPERLSRLAGAGSAVLGTFLFRDEAILMIDLGYHLYGEFCQEAEMPRIVVVCEINNTRYGFLLERINQIFRISRDQLQAPSLPGGGEDSKAIAGVVSLDGGDIMMLNVEDIIEDLVGGGESIAAADASVGVAVAAHRARTRVMVVDDSHTVREQLTRLLSEAGFAEVQIHRNGQEAYEALAAVRTGADASVDVLVTYIEMPLMDGLTLCRRLKEEVAGFPVVILSSMVTQQIADKCRQVGGDAYLSKQDLRQVVAKLDAVCGVETEVAG